MITAKDVAKLIKARDPIFDKFIEEKLIPVLTSSGKYTTSIPAKTIADFYISNGGKFLSSSAIMNQFKIRGFLVKYECDDRPAGSCWYEVDIPPGEE